MARWENEDLSGLNIPEPPKSKEIFYGNGGKTSEQKMAFAKLISKEVGKPINECLNEANGSVEEFEWFMKNAEYALKDEITQEDSNSIHRIVFEPFGTAAVITPWNYPLGMAIWGIVPNLIGLR